MTVEDYSKKVSDLLKGMNGKIPGLKLGIGEKVRMNISSINGVPTLVFSKVDDNFEPIEVVTCLELDDVQTVHALQVWLSEAMSIFAHKELMKSEVNALNEEK